MKAGLPDCDTLGRAMPSSAVLSTVMDVDALAHEVRRRVMAGIRWWKRGALLSEEPLLNHIIGRVLYNGTCDAGLTRPLQTTSSVRLLHRMGPKQQDKFGSDLALTLAVPEVKYLKTAFLQMKTTSSSQVVLRRDQAEAASMHSFVKDRAFVAVVNSDRNWVRISDLPAPQKFGKHDTMTVDCGPWSGLTQWFLEWLRCSVGVPSQPYSTDSPEAALYFFQGEPEAALPWGVEQYQDLRGLLTESDAPARSWLIAEFSPLG